MAEIQKSENDKRLYRQVTLTNGLRALLISDPEMRVDSKDSEESQEDELAERSESQEDSCAEEVAARPSRVDSERTSVCNFSNSFFPSG